MKKRLIKMFFLFVVTAVMSCGPKDPSYYYISTIKNISSYNVKLEIFYKNQDINTDTIIQLIKNSEMKIEYINQIVEYPLGFPSDSVYMKFNNGKRIIYRKGDGQKRNILDINSWAGGKIDDLLDQYEYTITNEDYANAVPIE